MAAKREGNMDGTQEMRTLRSAPLAGETIPSRVRLAPWGAVESTNGSFLVDDEAVRLVVAAFEEHGTDLPIDYEHQTLGGSYSSPTGQAPAAGWIKRLIGEPGVGLLADIEWTPQATAMLVSKQYRYLSPVAMIRKADRKIVAIHSAALTNKPAIVGMEPIVNTGSRMAPEPGEDPLAVLRVELNLPPEAEAREILLAASHRLLHLQQETRRRHVEERVLKAIRVGKLVEAQRSWAEELVAREEALFDEWFRTAPVVVTPGLLLPPSKFETTERCERAAAARARAEFRSHRLLSSLTSEEAYVKEALRESGVAAN